MVMGGMRNPKEELQDLVDRAQNNLEVIREKAERLLPHLPENVPFSQMTEQQLNIGMFKSQLNQQLDILRRQVNELRIRAMRGLPRI